MANHAQGAPVVRLIDGVPVTTSLAIAEGTEHEHRAVLKLLRTHLEDFEAFGRVAFEVRPFETAGGTQQREIAILNEHQATLLVTFMRNIGVVKEFKKRLVREFYELAHAAPRVSELETHQPHLDTLRAFLATRTETNSVELINALGLEPCGGDLTRVGLLMAQCPDWRKVRPQRSGRRGYVWRRSGPMPCALPPSEPARAALPPAPLPADLHAFIFQHAHRLSAAAFDPLREWMEREARAHLAQGYSPEFARAWLEKHVGHPRGEVLLMRAQDVAGLASTLAAVRVLVEVELDRVARLEGELGRMLYGRASGQHATR